MSDDPTQESYGKVSGGPWDEVGKLLVEAGEEDTPQNRKEIGGWLANDELSKVSEKLKIKGVTAACLYEKFLQAFGDPH